MGNSNTGVKGQPVITTTPSTVADMQAIADYAALVGNVKVLTTSQRTALTGVNVWEGLAVWDTTISGRYVYRSSAWVRDSPWRWANAAARAASTGMAEGDVGDQLDTNIVYRYDGSNWKAASAGLIPIVPTSVAGTGVTVGANGTVTLAATTAASLNGCFTAEFDNYVVLVTLSASSGADDLMIQVRAAGSNLISATYLAASTQSASATPSTAYNATATSIKVLRTNGVGGGRARFEVMSPFLSEYTSIFGQGSDAISVVAGGGTVLNATPYDGFSLITVAGTTTLTGRVRVYGYNNN